MEVLLVLGGIWLLFWLVPRAYDFLKVPAQNPPTTPYPTSRQTSSQPSAERTYRPKPSGRPKIQFDDPSPNSTQSLHFDLKDLHDAFTGAPLDPTLGLHQCTKCQVYYHSASFDVLQAENAGRCVACGSKTIVKRGTQEAKAWRGRDHDPDVITLSNFRSHFDRVVTFEGVVREVKASKSGRDYALMFEQASWSKGLKLVVFERAIASVGGVNFIKGLHGKQVRVRGLLINHRLFGPEIIISERKMILGVR